MKYMWKSHDLQYNPLVYRFLALEKKLFIPEKERVTANIRLLLMPMESTSTVLVTKCLL